MSEPIRQDVGRDRKLWIAPERWNDVFEIIVALDEDGAPASVGAGRGELRTLRFGLLEAIVRRYRRGGALRALLPDAFLSPQRALAEMRALQALAPLGLAPRPIAVEARGRGLLRLRLATELVPGARNLLDLARESPERLDVATARAAGVAVRAMHDAGVQHPDLSAGNILVAGDRVLLVDFDGATVVAGPVAPEERERELLRLARSVDKWIATSAIAARARAAFLRAALPRERRLAVWREARRRAAKLGRAPR